ncbi:unnamed protein product [Nesidiocoris tenuis]|uniref:Uncharacterized protein n=1 Tax=Nesidiocoris tenuis TaxID=355587 RepID=A0A6H5HTW1_9HEMI|nr:unnamed protein product [Nesidiocoris tenuis]
MPEKESVVFQGKKRYVCVSPNQPIWNSSLTLLGEADHSHLVSSTQSYYARPSFPQICLNQSFPTYSFFSALKSLITESEADWAERERKLDEKVKTLFSWDSGHMLYLPISGIGLNASAVELLQPFSEKVSKCLLFEPSQLPSFRTQFRIGQWSSLLGFSTNFPNLNLFLIELTLVHQGS